MMRRIGLERLGNATCERGGLGTVASERPSSSDPGPARTASGHVTAKSQLPGLGLSNCRMRAQRDMRSVSSCLMRSLTPT